MAACPRNEIVRLGEVAVYHCWSRCVRRARLCGTDEVSGNNYDHRREWIQSLGKEFARLFAIEFGFHAEMANHVHLVIRTRPDVVDSWSDEEVVNRWLTVTLLVKSKDGQVRAPDTERVSDELRDPDRIAQFRENLSNPSCLMGSLCEHISRRSNQEDECTGRFWEDRYKCRELADESAILVCGIYVDLNQIRAGEARTPEESRHTSAYDRIEALRHQPGVATPRPDEWLCNLSLDERRAVNSPEALECETRASNHGLLPVTLLEYLELLDASGRIVREGKGAIPRHLEPIITRLGIQFNRWIEAINDFQSLFGRWVGRSGSFDKRVRSAGRRWYQGQRNCLAIFG